MVKAALCDIDGTLVQSNWLHAAAWRDAFTVAGIEVELEEARRQIGKGGDELIIAHELLVSVRGNITVDWMHRDAARARIRVTVKRILRKYGYPPDLQDAAVQTVLQQAEALSAEWAEAL